MQGLRVEELAAGPDGLRCVVHVEPGCGCFAGHFPGQPLLPGVAQLVLLQEVLQQTLGQRLAIVRNVRFRQPVRPGDRLELRATLPRPDGTVSFELRRDGTAMCGGNVGLGEASRG